MVMTGYTRIMKSGRELTRSTGSAASALPASKCVPAADARCPPAEKPMMPMRSGSSFHILPLARTVRMARCASRSGTSERPLGNRYSSITPVMPCRLSHAAMPCPSGPTTSVP
jgi:hypothetical protein